jgi:hypothetical protein
MRSHDGRQFALFLLNKDGHEAEIVISLGPAANLRITHSREILGQSPEDVAPVVRDCASPQTKDGALRATLSPLSVTVVRFGG